ncbi:hypothetical protein DFH11DRAFT_1879014 [Phellopilus nigrolimitatus]|nr:hypothetical protein DFH11DRAFT_1879014 [Phellopilus nigrolimitatus]
MSVFKKSTQLPDRLTSRIIANADGAEADVDASVLDTPLHGMCAPPVPAKGGSSAIAASLDAEVLDWGGEEDEHFGDTTSMGDGDDVVPIGGDEDDMMELAAFKLRTARQRQLGFASYFCEGSFRKSATGAMPSGT